MTRLFGRLVAAWLAFKHPELITEALSMRLYIDGLAHRNEFVLLSAGAVDGRNHPTAIGLTQHQRAAIRELLTEPYAGIHGPRMH